MPHENPLAVAGLCRLEACRTDCDDMRVALLSLARAIEAADAEVRRGDARPGDLRPGSAGAGQMDAIIAAILRARTSLLGPSSRQAAAGETVRGGSAPRQPADGAGERDERWGIVFSYRDGSVWASWAGPTASLELGPAEEVIEMMRDFLAQTELGERLMQRATRPARAQ